MILSKSNITLQISRKILRNNIRKMSTAESDVLIEEINNKGLLTLNRPKALNALNTSMVEKIIPALKKWENEKILVIVKGAGDKAFCSGGDVKSVTVAAKNGDYSAGQDFFRKEYAMNGIIGSYRIPYIALIDGIVMGGGVGVSVHGKYRVATERTLFAMPETQIGLFPDVGTSYTLPRLTGRLGWYLALTGQRLKGSDVYKSGIATHYCESKNIKDLEKSLFDCKSADEIDGILKKFSAPINKEFTLSPYLDKINHCFSGKNVEEVFERLEKDGSNWAEETLKTLSKMSPTSLKIAYKELNAGQKLNSLLDCLQMEYRLAVSSLSHHDFVEGVRALLVDKDQKPVWKPPTLKEVTDNYVDSFFTKLPEDQELRHKL